MVSPAYLRLLIFLPGILTPDCASSSPAFLMMYSAYKLNKQGDNIQPWCSPFPVWSQSVVPCPVLTVASWPAYRFLRRQFRWSAILLSFRIFHSLLWSTQSKNIITWPKWIGSKTKNSDIKKFATTNHTPSSFGIKEDCILIWAWWFFGTLVHHLLGLLTFQIKLENTNTLSLDLSVCCALSRMTLDSVIQKAPADHSSARNTQDQGPTVSSNNWKHICHQDKQLLTQ